MPHEKVRDQDLSMATRPVRRAHVPVGLGVVGIAVVFPGGDFLDEDLFVGNAAVEALGR